MVDEARQPRVDESPPSPAESNLTETLLSNTHHKTRMSIDHHAEPLWKFFRSIPKVPAATILEHWRINDTPVPVEKIVRAMGVEIQLVDTEDFAGFSETSEDRAVVKIRSRDARVRQRFTLAHEICHVLWHPTGVQYRDADFMPSSHREVEANGFAAGLLMPEWMVRSAMTAIGYEPLRLAAMFDVSTASMNYRLRQLGLL